MRNIRTLALLTALAAIPGPARAIPDAVGNPFTPIRDSGIRARLTPLAVLPADSTVPDTARALIQYATPLRDGTGRLFINDLKGQLYVTSTAGAPVATYLDLRTQGIGFSAYPYPSGPGFSGVAFHPNFNGDPALPGYGKFYTTGFIQNPGTASIGTADTGQNVEIREWTTANPAAPTFSGTSRAVMTIGGGGNNGTIAFNPTATINTSDYGKLYIGQASNADNDDNHFAQDLSKPQGKILRIDPLQGALGEPYTVPSDNPFIGQSGKLAEVWASGLRLPQSFNWDIATGAMYINDLGESIFEEVNPGIKGADYGWGLREGNYATAWAYGVTGDYNIYPIPAGDTGRYTNPIAEYYHSEGYALGSGFVYRGTKIPALIGKYVMADIVLGRLFVFDPAAAVNGPAPLTELLLTQDDQILDLSATYGYSSFVNGPRVDARLSQDADGELLLAMKATGTLYALDAEPIPEPATVLLLAALVPLARLRERATATRA